MAYQENQFRVCVEFLRAARPGVGGRAIRLNHSPAQLPPQLQGRLHPGYWAKFMEDAGQLSLRHPYVEKPGAKDCCQWAACFGLGAVVGLFCINPDAGDYGVWTAEAQQLVERWAPGFAQAGCTLSLQRTRDFWLQIDINPNVPLPPQPIAPPLPAVVAAQQDGAAPGVAPAPQALPVPDGKPTQPASDGGAAGYQAV